MTRDQLLQWLCQPSLGAAVQSQWHALDQAFRQVQHAIPAEHRMPRTELSFHQDTRLLGYLAVLIESLPGDVLEIGVWKGKSLALMQALTQGRRQVIGIDPLVLPNQATELPYYKKVIYPTATVIQAFSERALDALETYTQSLSLLHIDGGHEGRNVLLDFLLYEPLVVPGGFVLFDDYRDFEHSPEVGPAVDLLRVGGFFKRYTIFGNVPGFENSYLIRKNA